MGALGSRAEAQTAGAAPGAGAPVAGSPASSGAAPVEAPADEGSKLQGPQDLTPSRSLPIAGRPLAVPLPRTGAGKPLQWRPEWSRFD
ncbi:MAG: hypothetical protein EOO75_19175, partial [Myxococcales bacterium]